MAACPSFGVGGRWRGCHQHIGIERYSCGPILVGMANTDRSESCSNSARTDGRMLSSGRVIIINQVFDSLSLVACSG